MAEVLYGAILARFGDMIISYDDVKHAFLIFVCFCCLTDTILFFGMIGNTFFSPLKAFSFLSWLVSMSLRMSCQAHAVH